jgi:GT2 family glycosyltransferase
MLPVLCVVILNWNLKNDTLACVESVLASGVPADQVIVMDNGSTDGTAQAVAER